MFKPLQRAQPPSHHFPLFAQRRAFGLGTIAWLFLLAGLVLLAVLSVLVPARHWRCWDDQLHETGRSI